MSQGRRLNRPSTTMMVMGHHVKTSDWKVSYMSGVENSCFTAKGGPGQANRPSTTMRPSTTKRPSTTMMVMGHHVKTSDWKVSYMSGVEMLVLLRREAQEKQIGPVPPWGPVPPRGPVPPWWYWAYCDDVPYWILWTINRLFLWGVPYIFPASCLFWTISQPDTNWWGTPFLRNSSLGALLTRRMENTLREKKQKQWSYNRLLEEERTVCDILPDYVEGWFSLLTTYFPSLSVSPLPVDALRSVYPTIPESAMWISCSWCRACAECPSIFLPTPHPGTLRFYASVLTSRIPMIYCCMRCVDCLWAVIGSLCSRHCSDVHFYFRF